MARRDQSITLFHRLVADPGERHLCGVVRLLSGRIARLTTIGFMLLAFLLIALAAFQSTQSPGDLVAPVCIDLGGAPAATAANSHASKAGETGRVSGTCGPVQTRG